MKSINAINEFCNNMQTNEQTYENNSLFESVNEAKYENARSTNANENKHEKTDEMEQNDTKYEACIGRGYKICIIPENDLEFAASGAGEVVFAMLSPSGETLRSCNAMIQKRGFVHLREYLKEKGREWISTIPETEDVKENIKQAWNDKINASKISAPMWDRDSLITQPFENVNDCLSQIVETGIFHSYMKKLFVTEMGEDTRVVRQNGVLSFLCYSGNSWVPGENYVRNAYNNIVDLIPSLFMPLLEKSAEGREELIYCVDDQGKFTKQQIKDKYGRYWKAEEQLKSLQRDLLREPTRKGVMTDLLLSAQAESSSDFTKYTDRLTLIDYYDPKLHVLIACKNVIIDTETGKIYEPHEFPALKHRYPLSYINREYRYDNTSKVFDEHLIECFTDNITPEMTDDERNNQRDQLVPYFKRILGYSLYHNNKENMMVMMVGKKGGNGKSTTINAIKTILGSSECKGVPSSELYPNDQSNRAYPNLAKSLQARCIIFDEFGSESDDEKSKNYTPYSTPTIKQLTGNDICDNFRPFYDAATSQHIVALPIAVSNTMPRFTSIDDALLRRIVAIPFNHVFRTFNHDSGKTNLNKSSELIADADNIFTMMVNELRVYLTEGMIKTPKFVTQFQHSLLVSDVHASFVQNYLEKTEVKWGSSERMTRRELHECFIKWANYNDIDIQTYTKKEYSTDQFGMKYETGEQVILKSAEVEALKRALKIDGFEQKMTNGKDFVYCKLKNAEA